MQEPIVKKFKINGLHGYKNIEIDFVGPARIIIAENGTGKTTVLAALHAFLKKDFYKLAKLKFESIECTLSGLNEPLVVMKADLVGFESSGAEIEVEKLSRYTSRSSADVRDAITKLEDVGSFSESALLQEIYITCPFDGEEFVEILTNVRQAITEIPKDLAETMTILGEIVGKLELLYLPTYRRVELPSAKGRAPRRGVGARAPRSREESTDGIKFGLRDVQDRLVEILNDIQRYSNSQYRTISAAIIDDALGGKINPTTFKQSDLPDIDALRLFFSRVETEQSKTDRLESLKKLYETGEINSQDQLILRYFLSKLGAVVDRTRQLESNVEKFVEKVNVYLDLSSDEKTLTYDSNLMKVIVKNNFSGDEIDLDALSSGEKQVISLFSHLYLEPGRKFVLIDEPELSLSIDWQKRLLPDIVSSPSCAQLLAITHSPFIFDNELDPFAGPMGIQRVSESAKP